MLFGPKKDVIDALKTIEKQLASDKPISLARMKKNTTELFVVGSTCMHIRNSSLKMPPVKTIESLPDINFKQVCHDSVTGL